MTQSDARTTVKLHSVDAPRSLTPHDVTVDASERERYDDVAFMTAMTLVLMGNYAQTGHYGGPLAYTPYNVAAHLVGPDAGGLRYDIREPKLPFADKFMMAGGHSIPTCYALWMILYEAMLRQGEATGDGKYAFDPKVAILSIDALGFRRGPDALKTLLADNGLAADPLFSQAALRGIRPLMGHSETTDVTNDVNGGPSGIGISTSAGKALFWDFVGAPDSLKVLALEGEFALTEGHAQELKTAALAQRVGRRLRVLMSMNNAGIDDDLIGGVINEVYTGYDIGNQWASYGWNVLRIDDGNDFAQVFAALQAMEQWPAEDRRPMIAIGNTLKGWWPGAVDHHLEGYDGELLVGYPSHPYALKMNCDYFVALAESYERHFGVEFAGIRDGVPGSEAERLIEFKTNIDVALSVLDDQPDLRAWIADRLVAIGDSVDRSMHVNIPTDSDPFLDERLLPENLPAEPVEVALTNKSTGEVAERTITLFRKPGDKAGTRRAISEIGAWLNYVTDNRFFTIAADLSGSINIENANFFGHYDPVLNPAGTRLKAPIEEAVNAATIAGLANQTV
ncbi:MAG: hypothetical protein ACK2UL_05445, partial [Anaerolineae bacterium]